MKLLLWSFFFLGGLFAQAQSSAGKHHYIFFVHGIGGSVKSFGAMPEALTHHLNAAKPETIHEAFSFVYPTADQSKTTEDFAILLGQFVDQKLKDRIQPEDKISFVSHSQGGIVTLIWYFHAYRQLHKIASSTGLINGVPQFLIDYNPKYIRYLDAVVSLGSPYWGSKLATFLTSDSFLSKSISKMFFTQLGRRQLDEMSLMSETNSKFRKNVTTIPNEILSHMGSEIRPLAIAGIADVVEIFSDKTYGLSKALNIFKGLTFGTKYWESDGAVPLPAARFDSIYTIDRSLDYKHGQVTGLAQTRVTNFTPLLIVNALHASPNAEKIPDIVEAPVDCIRTLECKHPTFRYVFDHLAGRPVPMNAPDAPIDSLGGFIVSIRINFPAGTVIDKRKVDIRLMNANRSSDYKFVLASDKELISHTEFINPNEPNIFYRTGAGHFTYKDETSNTAKLIRQDGATAIFLIQAPGYRAHYIETTLKPTYSTFIEVNLIPLQKETLK